MVFKKRAVSIFNTMNTRSRYTANSKGNSIVINELLIDRDIIFELKVSKDDKLVYEVCNIPSLQLAEIEAEKYAKSLINARKNKSVSLQEINSTSYQYNAKLNSLEIKMNALIKKYPDEQGIQEIKDYFETII